MRYLIAAILIGLLLRIGLLAGSYGWIPNGDPENYLALAQSVAAGDGLVRVEDAYPMPLWAFYPPLYPLLLGNLGATTQPAILAVNFLIDVGAAVALVWLGGQIARRELGMAVAAAYVLWPLNILSATAPQKEGLSTLFVIPCAALLVRASRQPSTLISVPLGSAAGLLALTQPALLPLPGLFALLLFDCFSKGQWWRTCAIAAAAALLVMLPWWVRNYAVFNSFVPLTTSGGFSLWLGALSPTGGWIPPPPEFLTGDELQMSRLAAREAWAWIVQHPLGYVVHCMMKVVHVLLGIGWNLDRLLLTTQMPVGLLKPVILAMGILLNAAAIVGLVIGRGIAGRLLIASVAHLFLFQMWFEVQERHTYYLVPFLMLAAAMGWERVKNRSDLSSSGAFVPADDAR